jgi:hypothetical protein
MSHRTAPQVTTLNRLEYMMASGRPPAAARGLRFGLPEGAGAARTAALAAATLVFLCGLMVGVVAI